MLSNVGEQGYRPYEGIHSGLKFPLSGNLASSRDLRALLASPSVLLSSPALVPAYRFGLSVNDLVRHSGRAHALAYEGYPLITGWISTCSLVLPDRSTSWTESCCFSMTADKGSLLHRVDQGRHLCCLVCRSTCITFIVGTSGPFRLLLG